MAGGWGEVRGCDPEEFESEDSEEGVEREGGEGDGSEIVVTRIKLS